MSIKSTTILLLALSASIIPLVAKESALVPYPKEVAYLRDSQAFPLNDGFNINYPEEFEAAAHLFLNDIETLYQIKPNQESQDASIHLQRDNSLKEGEYEIHATGKSIILKACSKNAMLTALTTLSQMIQADASVSIPACFIKDTPSFDYRCYMIDLARQWVEIETIKNIIDLCRWYKIHYVQLHLSDFQMFTFGSELYPQLTEGKKHYSQDELRELVAYADARGVTLIPELDLPGHSSALSRAMPELFGNPSWGVIDMVNPTTMSALKAIIKEMMAVFHSSPYFHIGADEVELHQYEKLDHVKQYIKDKGFDNAYDVYMQCIVDLHNFVKSCGKKTLVWESFHGTGSEKVRIPTDLTVIAWDSTFQSPMSLIENGYQVVNGSWIPFYMTPRRRWSPESIYKWNPRRWDIFWKARNPISWDYPIQLKPESPIEGMQMCAWEMSNSEQLITGAPRIAPFSEIAWNADSKQSYTQHASRAIEADKRIQQLIFPAIEEREGFKEADPMGLDDNLINTFRYQAKVFFKPLNPSDSIYYSSNNTFPSLDQAQQLTEPLLITTTGNINLAIYDQEKQLKAYKSIRYEIEQIDVSYEGEIIPTPHPQINILQEVTFKEKLIITLSNAIPNTTLYYTLDGSKPSTQSIKYTGPITLKGNAHLYVYSIQDSDGKPPAKSMSFSCKYIKATSTTK